MRVDGEVRFAALDGMRGVAAISVMLMHYSQHTSNQIFYNAGLAVDIFFCLSGFVIAYSYRMKLLQGMSPIGFVIKRIIRLYPVYLIGLIFGGLALFIKIVESQTSFTMISGLYAFFLNAIYLPYLGENYIAIGSNEVVGAVFPINDPYWSLFFELLINFGYAFFLVKNGARANFGVALLAAIGLILFCVQTHSVAPGWSVNNFSGGLLRVTYGFVVGALLFEYQKKILEYIPSVPLFFMFFVLIGILSIPYMKGLAGALWIFGAIFLAPALVAMATKVRVESSFNLFICKKLGGMSYPLYCVHFPIYSIYTSITLNSDNGLFGVIFCASIALVISFFVDKILDKKS